MSEPYTSGVIAADYFATFGTTGKPIKILGLVLLGALFHFPLLIGPYRQIILCVGTDARKRSLCSSAAMSYRAMYRLIIHPVFVDILTWFIPTLSFDPTVQVDEVAKVSFRERQSTAFNTSQPPR